MKFTGQFNQLKHKGFKFLKMYGRNHICYLKRIKPTTVLDGNEYGGVAIWVWKKGRDIEIDDYYDATSNIVEFFKKNLSYWEWKKVDRDSPKSLYKLATLNLMFLILDRSTKELRFKLNEDSDVALTLLMLKASTEKEKDEVVDKWYKDRQHLRTVDIDVDKFKLTLKEIDDIQQT